MPPSGLPMLARSSDDALEKPMVLPVSDLTLSSPATNASCSAASSSTGALRRSARTSSAVTDGGAAAQCHNQQKKKARRCWSPELHREFVAALQRLGGAEVATPKKIRKLMRVDGLTNGEVKSHLQKCRLHTWRRRRASSSDGGDDDDQAAADHRSAVPEQHNTSQHNTLGSPQAPCS